VGPGRVGQDLARCRAKYVVLTAKHHDGFTLWPSSTPNPTLAADRQHASRDLVGELTAAVRKQGLGWVSITPVDTTGRLCPVLSVKLRTIRR